MSKLWEKEYSFDKVIEEYTVGDDPLLDLRLVNADCVASIAHAVMLESIGILAAEELAGLRRELAEIIRRNDAGEFVIRVDEEDCHTAIENRLVEKLGEAGKKIHTGRSRNDQIIAALRLHARSALLALQRSCLQLAATLRGFAARHAGVPMPGRTHMQIAMPSSVGLWAGAYAEELLDDLRLLDGAYDLNNLSPLGSAASYGVPLPLDRELVAELLGFRAVQNNVLYVNNSRGKFESVIVDALEQVMLTLSKLAQDVILFSMPEFRYFTLPRELCGGSSIMPQKRNPGMLELMRAKAATVGAAGVQIKGIIRSLPSGYNRDYQETKGPFLRSLSVTLASVRVAERVVQGLTVDERALLAGFVPEIYATDRALQLVASGVPFRDAYRQVAASLESLERMDPHEAIRRKTHTGTTGKLNLELVEQRIEEHVRRINDQAEEVGRCVRKLTGVDVAL
ncbi:MAG: argininosuccinate lyase [Spirochaetales bacterium]|nr:argininosuccinate lyase [Spirochaetales bacterium]